MRVARCKMERRAGLGHGRLSRRAQTRDKTHGIEAAMALARSLHHDIIPADQRLGGINASAATVRAAPGQPCEAARRGAGHLSNDRRRDGQLRLLTVCGGPVRSGLRGRGVLKLASEQAGHLKRQAIAEAGWRGSGRDFRGGPGVSFPRVSAGTASSTGRG